MKVAFVFGKGIEGCGVGAVVGVAVGNAVGLTVGAAVGVDVVPISLHVRSDVDDGAFSSSSVVLSHTSNLVQYLFEVGVGAALCHSEPGVQFKSGAHTASFESVPTTEAYPPSHDFQVWQP